MVVVTSLIIYVAVIFILVIKANAPNNCFNPTKQYADASNNERTTHEIRIASDEDQRVRFIAGAYYNDVETSHSGEFQYLSTNDAFSDPHRKLLWFGVCFSSWKQPQFQIPQAR